MNAEKFDLMVKIALHHADKSKYANLITLIKSNIPEQQNNAKTILVLKVFKNIKIKDDRCILYDIAESPHDDVLLMKSAISCINRRDMQGPLFYIQNACTYDNINIAKYMFETFKEDVLKSYKNFKTGDSTVAICKQKGFVETAKWYDTDVRGECMMYQGPADDTY